MKDSMMKAIAVVGVALAGAVGAWLVGSEEIAITGLGAAIAIAWLW